MSESLMWRTTSRFHDWSDGRFLTALFNCAWELGIIERVDWLTNADREDPRPVNIDNPQAFAEKILERLCRAPEPSDFKAGGKGAISWTLRLYLPAFEPQEQRLTSIAIAALVFDGDRFESDTASALLADAFRGVHGPDNTEYAGLHWQTRWHDLERTAYHLPVTAGPMFNGVVWANFLGPGHIDQFDMDVLKRSLPPENCTWIDDRGLFLVDDTSLGAIRSTEAEARLVALTDTFRQAQRA